jgi:hypothetical protein
MEHVASATTRLHHDRNGRCPNSKLGRWKPFFCAIKKNRSGDCFLPTFGLHPKVQHVRKSLLGASPVVTMSNFIKGHIIPLLVVILFVPNYLGFEFRPVVPWGTSPLHRYGHTMVELGASAVVFGGASQNVLLNDLWVFNGMSSTWSLYTLNGAGLSPRYFHAASKLSLDSLIISGGLSNISLTSPSAALSDAFLVRIDAQQRFRCLPLADLPAPLYGHALASTKSGIILFGGYSRPDTGSSHVWLLQNASFDRNAKWLLLSATGNPPSPRAFFVSGMLQSGGFTDSVFVVWGGLSTTGEIQTPLFTLTHEDTFAESGWRWISPVLKGTPPTPRAYAASVYTSKSLCIHGGQSSEGGILRDLWFLDRDIAGFYTWKLQSMPISAPSVWGHTLIVFETSNLMLFYGGQTADGTIEHRMFAYSIARGITSFVDFAGSVPAARHSAALSCLGSRLILHGGSALDISGEDDVSSLVPMNDVWQFHLSNAQWNLLRPFQTGAINAVASQSNVSSNSSNLTAITNSSFPMLLDEDVPRLFGHSMVTLGPIIVIFGGFSREAAAGSLTKPDNQLYSLDPRQGFWKKLKPPTSVIPAARAYHAHAAAPSSTLSTSLVIFGGIGNGNQVLGDAWLIPLNLFQPTSTAKGNVTDRMLAFDFNCRHVSFDTLVMKPFGSFSVSFWLFANVMPGEEQFLIGSASQYVKSSVDFAIHALPFTCTLQVSLNLGDRLYITTGSGKASICDIGWHHIVFTFDGVSSRGFLYIDGVADAELIVPAAATAFFRSTFFIGHLPTSARSSAPRSCWSGFIDRFSFWNVSLTPSQVVQFQFNFSNAFIHFSFDHLDFSNAASKGSGMIQATASFGSGYIAEAPALLPSSCPLSLADLKFNFYLRNSWAMLPSGPSNRSHAMMASATSSDIFLFGGRDASGSSLSDLWVLRNFDVPSLAQWEFIVPVQNMASPMSHAIIGSLGQFQAAIVGYNESSDAQVSLFADIGGYEKVVSRQFFDVRIPPAVGVAHCQCVDNTLWAFGGQDAVLNVPFDGFFRSDLTSPFIPIQGSGFSPPPLIDARHCQVNSTSILFVGRSALTGATESYLFTLTSHQWRQLTINPELLLSGGSLSSIQNVGGTTVIAFGGFSNSNITLIMLGSTISTRTIVNSNAPQRIRHGALSYGGMMWIFGGQTHPSSASYSNEIWTFNPQNLSWTLVTQASSLVPPPIISHTFHPVGNRAVVVGGQTLPPGMSILSPNRDVWVFDFPTRVWSSAIIPNFVPCVDMAAASREQYIYVYGGYILGLDEVSANIWISDTRDNVTNWIWKSFRTVGPEPRRLAFLGVMSSSLLLYGGLSNSLTGLSLTDMWEYGIDVADPKFCKVFGPNSKVAYAGIYNYFDIELRNVFNNVIGNSVFNEVDFWLLFAGNSSRFRGIIEHRSDTIRVIFYPQYVGLHTAFLELNQGTISLAESNEPFSINVLASEVDAAHSDFHLLFPNGSAAPVDSTLLVAAGDPLIFEIAFQDALNNVGQYLGRIYFSWYKIKIVPGTESTGNPVEYLDGSGTPPVEIKASGGGNYFIVGTLLEVANYSIIVKMGNQLVGGITYNFTLLSAALDPHSSLVLVEESTSYETTSHGIRKYPVGETVRIVVLLRDRFGNNITYALEDNFFVVRITSSKVPPLDIPEGKSDPLPEQVQSLLSDSSYENEAFSLVISDVVIEGLLLPKRIIRFFPFSLGDYHLHVATSNGQYLAGTTILLYIATRALLFTILAQAFRSLLTCSLSSLVTLTNTLCFVLLCRHRLAHLHVAFCVLSCWCR